MSLEQPRKLGPFLLMRTLAVGGMGEVFLAHQKLGVVERLCVVKTVRPDYAESEAAMRRFLDEAKTSSLLGHKNVAAVIDVGEADGTAYIAVEHVSGRDLHAVFQRSRRLKRPIPEDVALYCITELLDALAYVHRASDPRTGAPLHIVHRDVSPHNVMASFEGEVKLIDFGIARSDVKSDVTQTGQAVGKIRYMAPEQARAEKTVDGAADVFAACVVATELLTCRRYYGDMTMERLWLKVGAGEPHEPPGWQKIPSALRDVLAKGLEPEAKNRPTASDLKEELLEVQMQRGTLGSSDGLREHLELLFEGAQSEERQARAALLQEPTTVRGGHAADLIASGTKHEDTPLDDDEPGHVDPDAQTDSRLLTEARLGSGKTAPSRPSNSGNRGRAQQQGGTSPKMKVMLADAGDDSADHPRVPPERDVARASTRKSAAAPGPARSEPQRTESRKNAKAARPDSRPTPAAPSTSVGPAVTPSQSTASGPAPVGRENVLDSEPMYQEQDYDAPAASASPRSPGTSTTGPGRNMATSLMTRARRRRRRQWTAAAIVAVATPLGLIVGILLGQVTAAAPPADAPERPLLARPVVDVDLPPEQRSALPGIDESAVAPGIAVSGASAATATTVPTIPAHAAAQTATAAAPAAPTPTAPAASGASSDGSQVVLLESTTNTTRRPRPTGAKKGGAGAKPKLLGDRVRALKACSPRPECAKPVLTRAAELARLDADDLKALDEDVDWCLDQCK